MAENTLFSYRTKEDERALFDSENPLWNLCDEACIDRYWDGRSTLRQRERKWETLTRIGSLWNEEAIFFYAQCWFDSLNVNPDWGTRGPVKGSWNRDVVELFLRPAAGEGYFEIEISPLGQWLDVHVRKPRTQVDFDWDSRLKVKTVVSEEERIWRVYLALPVLPMVKVALLGRPPREGEAWRLNLYRITGKQPSRAYLTWRPTFTARPDFHVPASFGNLVFLAAPESSR